MMYNDCGCHGYHVCYHRHSYPRYGFGMFLLDLFLLAITGGLWALWIVWRFIRRNHC